MKLAENYRKGRKISGNKIVIVRENGIEEEVTKYQNLCVHYTGENSIVIFHEPIQLKNMLNIYCGENTFIEFGKNLIIRHPVQLTASGSKNSKNTTIIFGDNCSLGSGLYECGDESDLELIVGNDFLSSNEIYLKISDAHTILDATTKEIINKPLFGCHIGDHVWLGHHVSILKDVEIPNNCIVGASAVVGKKQFEPNSIIAGVPAKTIRSGVNWDSHAICQYETLNPN